MKVTLLGAAQEVTGSCYLVETESARLLVDCGLFQGSRRLERNNYIPAQIYERPIDAVLLTHGHLDHCGRLPMLFQSVSGCPVLATSGTIEIAKLIMSDAAKIQEDDVRRENRKRKRGAKRAQPLFGHADVDRVTKYFREVSYNEWIVIDKHIKARFREAGHIIGSASIELEVKENDITQRIVFSGDLGPRNSMLQCTPADIGEADCVFIETTYGDREHRSFAETLDEFEELVKLTVARKGKLLIPTFAVGRTQQLLYYFSELFRKGIVAPFPIYLDSPMAIAATEIYVKHHELLRKDLQLLESEDNLRRGLSTLVPVQTADESKSLNFVAGPCVIMAGAGMCNAGRIMHHLLHSLNEPSTIVMIVGYQATGSIGRKLVEGQAQVKIMGETVKVRALIRSLGGFSAHAGQADLLRWLKPLMKADGTKVILTHGESTSMTQFSYKVGESFAVPCQSPHIGDVIVLEKNSADAGGAPKALAATLTT
jgi:metallo-beta-lactamase family protein